MDKYKPSRIWLPTTWDASLVIGPNSLLARFSIYAYVPSATQLPDR